MVPNGIEKVIRACMGRGGKTEASYEARLENYLILCAGLARLFNYQKWKNQQNVKVKPQNQPQQPVVTPYSYKGTAFEDGVTLTISTKAKQGAQWNFIDLFGSSDTELIKSLVDDLLRWELLTEVKNAVWIGRKSPRVLALNVCFGYRSVVRYLKTKKGIDRAKKIKVKRLCKSEHPLFQRMIDTYAGRLTVPSLKEVERIARKMCAEGATNKEGRKYVWAYQESDFEYREKVIKLANGVSKTLVYRVLKNKRIVNIQSAISAYRTFLADGFWLTGADKEDRFYTPFTSMPKWIRALFLLDGKPLVENDYTALHPRIIGQLVQIEAGCYVDFLHGDAHAELGKLLGISRGEAKPINLAYWNSRLDTDASGKLFTTASVDNKENFAKLDSAIRESYPSFWSWLVTVKKDWHKNMSKLLLKHERLIMDRLIELLDPSEPFIYCFDCLYLTSKIDALKDKAFEEYFAHQRSTLAQSALAA
jgi:hypothetical protein